MLNRMKKTNNKGFTIIEVMIVLAIAALILLIVFLAVPALQRNSRNTNRKSDVGRVGAAVTTVLSNNNGAIASLTDPNIQAEVTNLGFYTTTNVIMGPVGTATVSNATTVDTVNISTNAICANFPAPAAGGAAPAGQGETKTGATTRSVAITYTVETGSGTRPSCIDQ